MVNVEARSTGYQSAGARSAPAAGCFGYTRSEIKPFHCQVTDPKLFAMLYAMGTPGQKG